MTDHLVGHIDAIHGNMATFLSRAINGNSNSSDNPNSQVVACQGESTFADFGARYKVFVRKANDNAANVVIDICVTLPGFDLVEQEGLASLRALYGASSIIIPQRKETEENDFTYDFIVRVVPDTMQKFFSGDEYALKLSQLRIQASGAALFQALSNLVDNEVVGDDGTSGSVHELATHPKCGTHLWLTTAEKVMVFFVVNFKDDVERVLARLFLQQFPGAQKHVAESPHCVFRRANDPPNEIKGSHLVANAITDASAAGILSLTFFPSHVKTPERRARAVEQVMNFSPYLDKQVKSAKSLMHARMRNKRIELLHELKELDPAGP